MEEENIIHFLYPRYVLPDWIKLTCVFYSKEPVQKSPQVEPQCRAGLYQYTLLPQHQQEIQTPVLVLEVGVVLVNTRSDDNDLMLTHMC